MIFSSQVEACFSKTLCTQEIENSVSSEPYQTKQQTGSAATQFKVFVRADDFSPLNEKREWVCLNSIEERPSLTNLNVFLSKSYLDIYHETTAINKKYKLKIYKV